MSPVKCTSCPYRDYAFHCNTCIFPRTEPIDENEIPEPAYGVMLMAMLLIIIFIGVVFACGAHIKTFRTTIHTQERCK